MIFFRKELRSQNKGMGLWWRSNCAVHGGPAIRIADLAA